MFKWPEVVQPYRPFEYVSSAKRKRQSATLRERNLLKCKKELQLGTPFQQIADETSLRVKRPYFLHATLACILCDALRLCLWAARRPPWRRPRAQPRAPMNREHTLCKIAPTFHPVLRTRIRTSDSEVVGDAVLVAARRFPARGVLGTAAVRRQPCR